MIVKLDDVGTPEIRRTRSVPQGDPCAADFFGAALHKPAARFCDVCQHKKKEDFPRETGILVFLLFADTCWIIAILPGELQTVTRAWNELLKAAGLQIDWGEAVWCSTAQDSLAASITVSAKLVTRRAREEGFKALGVLITVDGFFTEELAEREVAAWRLFYANRQLFYDNNVALKLQATFAHIMCRFIHVLVCRKLDSDKHAMYTSARSAGPHAENDDLRTKTPRGKR